MTFPLESGEACLQRIINVAQNIVEITRHSVNVNESSSTSSFVSELPHFPLPKPLAIDLLDLGVPAEIAGGLSASYMEKANSLKSTSELKVRETCIKLAQIPGQSITRLQDLQQQLHLTFCKSYQTTLDQWRQDALDLARSRLTPKEKPISASQNKGKGNFKVEFLPMFEYAFSKEPFPSREDKTRLCEITGMSFRQVTIWFQNRRSRPNKRRRTSSTPTPVPQTLEEVKALLSPSARASLDALGLSSNPNSPLYDGARPNAVETVPMSRFGSHVERSPSPVLTSDGTPYPQGSVVEDEDDGLSESESESIASSPPSPSPTSPTWSRSATPPPAPLCKPSSSLRVFPIPYTPLRLKLNPFAVEPPQWLRHPAEKRKRAIDPTPESIEDVVYSLKSLDTQLAPAPSTNSRPQKPLPRRARNAAGAYGLLNSRSSSTTRGAPPNSPYSPTALSEYSSEADDSPSSGFSSRSCSLSTMSSSTCSTPRFLETDLPEIHYQDSEGDDRIFSFTIDDVDRAARPMAGPGKGPIKSVNGSTVSSTAWEQLVATATSFGDEAS